MTAPGTDHAEAGAAACRAGVPWWRNPHPAGSVAAYQWDVGHTRVRCPERAPAGLTLDAL